MHYLTGFFLGLALFSTFGMALSLTVRAARWYTGIVNLPR